MPRSNFDSRNESNFRNVCQRWKSGFEEFLQFFKHEDLINPQEIPRDLISVWVRKVKSYQTFNHRDGSFPY